MSPKEDESEIAGLHEFSLEMLKLDFDAPALSPLNSSLMDEINAVGCDDQDEQSESELILSCEIDHMLDDLGPVNPSADIVIKWQSLSDDELLLLESLDHEEKSDTPAKERVMGFVKKFNEGQKRFKAVKTSRKTQTDTQREIDAYRAGPGRPDYNEYQRTLYAAKIEATEGRTVRSYGVPNNEAKLAKRRERNRLAAIASRERAKAKRAGA